ncbi:MAG: HupE/UreJ family protein [Alphaproteobacteria bacterium]|nr:HupE/UreJ family protein [Alphaproteobacteria bacterium]
MTRALKRFALTGSVAIGLAAIVFACVVGAAWAHGVQGKDAAFVAGSSGPQIIPFLYLGAKHMVTGYDHLLFILGVIFFLYRLTHVAIYVTLFSIGHSITLLAGVLGDIHVNPYLVDAVVGLSVAYKAFDNLGGFVRLFGFQPDLRGAVFGFGLVHGFGLATKLQDISLSPDGLVTNMLAFNVGVELGQLIALSAMLLLIIWWRMRKNFEGQAVVANAVLLCAGFLLTQYQLIGYFMERGA